MAAADFEKFLYTRGPTGRGIVVDADGRLIVNNDLGAGPFIYSFGDTGRPLSVDTSGRLLVRVVGSGGTGDITGASNLGSGSGLFAQENAGVLEFKSLIAGTNISISGNSNDLTISSSAGGGGEANTGSNIGASGVGVFSQKSGIDLQFRNIEAASTKADVLQNADVILVDVVPSAISSNSLSGPLSVLNGGTNANSASDARINLGLAIGSDVQAHDDNLDEIAVLDPASGVVIVGNGIEWVSSSGTNFLVQVSGVSSAENIGAGTGLFAQKDGTILQFKGISGGDGVSLSSDADTITIDADVTDLQTAYEQGSTITATSANNAVAIIAESILGLSVSGPLLPGGTHNVMQVDNSNGNTSGIALLVNQAGDEEALEIIQSSTSNMADVVRIRNSGIGKDIIGTNDTWWVDASGNAFFNSITPSGEDTTQAVNVGLGEGVFAEEVINTLEFRSLLSGSGIQVLGSGDTIHINSRDTETLSQLRTDFDNASGVWVKDGENLGSGSGVFFQKDTDENLEFRTLIAGNGIGINQSATELEIFSDVPEEATTASNIGIGSGEVFAQQVANDLQFRRLLAGSGIFVTTSGNTVILDWTHLDDFNNLSSDVTTLRTDFDNSSGIFQGGVNTANEVRTDFDNSSGIFQTGTDTANQVRTDFDNSSGIFVKNLENLGGAEEIFIQKDVNQNAEIRTLIGSSGVIVSTSGNTIRFDNTLTDDFTLLESDLDQLRTDFDNASGVWVKDGQNLGAGSGIFVQKDVDNNLEFKTITAGANVTLSGSATELNISSTGGSDVDPSGISTFKHIATPIFDDGTQSGSYTIDWDQGNIHRITLNGSTTFTLDNPQDGGRYTIIIKVSAGPQEVTWPATVEWPGGNAPDILGSTSDTDIVTMFYDSVDDVYYADFALDFS